MVYKIGSGHKYKAIKDALDSFEDAIFSGSAWHYLGRDHDDRGGSLFVFKNTTTVEIITFKTIAEANVVFGMSYHGLEESLPVCLEFRAISHAQKIDFSKELITSNLNEAKAFLKRYSHNGYIEFRINKSASWEDAYFYKKGNFTKCKNNHGTYVNFNQNKNGNKVVKHLVQLIQDSTRFWNNHTRDLIISAIEGNFGHKVDILARKYTNGKINLSLVQNDVDKLLLQNRIIFENVSFQKIVDIVCTAYENDEKVSL